MSIIIYKIYNKQKITHNDCCGTFTFNKQGSNTSAHAKLTRDCGNRHVKYNSMDTHIANIRK